MYRDISLRAAARVVVCAASTPCYLSARPSTGPSVRLHRSTHVVRVMSQLGAARKGEDAVGQPRVLAAELMSPADLLAGDTAPDNCGQIESLSPSPCASARQPADSAPGRRTRAGRGTCLLIRRTTPSCYRRSAPTRRSV